MLSVKEAASEACVCESIVRGWLADGQLPHFRIGAKKRRGKILIAVEDLQALLLTFKVIGRASLPTPKRTASVKLRHLKVS